MSRPASTQPARVAEKSGWALTFQDEFDQPTLDERKWHTRYRAGRIQYYKARNIAGKPHEAPLAHYVIENGVLHLRIDERLPRRAAPTAGAVSSIQTSDYSYDPKADAFVMADKFSQKHGWFEIRCRMPAGSGLHSAFWLLQTDPRDQEYTPDGRRRQVGDGVVEIDIFEQLGRKTAARVNDFNVHFTRNGHREYKMPFDPSRDFHVWALEWNEGELNWHLDGRKIWTYAGDTPQKPMGIFLGLYQGAGWTGPVDPHMPYPRDFEIDYVRVYRRLVGPDRPGPASPGP